MLEAGDEIVPFCLESDAGSTVTVPGKARFTVVYFYPRDSTPGCTREAQAFSLALDAFRAAGAAVYGVSKDSTASHAKFRTGSKLTVPLLSDPELTVHRTFGAYGAKKLYGRSFEGTIRCTFLLDRGVVVRTWPSVKVDGHAEAVLEAVQAFARGEAPPPAKKAAAPKRAPAAPAKQVASTKKTPANKAPAKAAKKVATKKLAAPAKKRAARTGRG